MDRFDSVADKIQSYGELEDNWNGYGAKAITPTVCQASIFIYLQLKLDFDMVTPTARNSIQFERANENRDYFEMEVFENEVHIFAVNEGDLTDMLNHRRYGDVFVGPVMPLNYIEFTCKHTDIVQIREAYNSFYRIGVGL